MVEVNGFALFIKKTALSVGGTVLPLVEKEDPATNQTERKRGRKVGQKKYLRTRQSQFGGRTLGVWYWVLGLMTTAASLRCSRRNKRGGSSILIRHYT